MSKSENMLAFEAALKKNEELREKFAAAQKRIAENKEAESDGDLLVKAAAEVGYTLTLEELERAVAQAQELSEDDLNTVSGGAAASDDQWCWADYYCHYVYEHDEDGNTDRACFHDYYCIFILTIDPETASY